MTPNRFLCLTSDCAGATDSEHLRVGQFRVKAAFASWWTIAEAVRAQFVAQAILPRCVSHVVGVCADEQVRRVDARRVIAMMQYVKPVRDDAERQAIRRSVRSNH